MPSNNIITFPKKKIETPFPQSLEEIEDNMEMIRTTHVQETIETIMPIFFDQLSIAGFQPSEEDGDVKDGALVIEAVRSLLLKSYGVQHPFQIIAQNIFEEDQNGMLSIIESMKFIINPKEEG
jgi:hypothetical protein